MIEERYKAFGKKILRLYKSKLRLIYLSEIGQPNEVVGSLKQNSGSCETRFFYCSIIKCYTAEREMNLSESKMR